tara:strand:+ start:1155 stop:2084 length:930 start_codon:yes stop_codon:yes gene_type:complete
MINPGENVQKLDPQQLKGQDREAYDRLAQEKLAAQENLKDVKNKPLSGTPGAQQARVNYYIKKLNDIDTEIDNFLAEGSAEKYFHNYMNTRSAESNALKKNTRYGPGGLAPVENYNYAELPNMSEQELGRLAKSIGVENVDKLKAFGGIGLKVLGYLDEEILLTKPLELASKGLKAAGYGKTAAGAAALGTKIAAYETYWMLANVGMAAYAQLQGELGESNPELQNLIGNAMMSSATGVPSAQSMDVGKEVESVPFDNVAQLEKDMKRWAKYSMGVQAYQATIGKATNTEDIVSLAMNGIRPMLGANNE